MKILVINPGSTSTKIAVYNDEECIFKQGLSHSVEELAPYKAVIDQHEFRKDLIINVLKGAGIELKFDAIVARGGLLKPIPGGTYRVNDKMIEDVRTSEHHHASDLGCIIAREIAKDIDGCDAFIADPVVVDELNDYARVCGSPLIKRMSIWHPLNQRAIARRYAKEHDLMLLHTGDLIDFVSEANLDAAARHYLEGDWFVSSGNHEFSQYVGEAKEDEAYKQQSYQKVQEAYPNDLTFCSRV
ncbi:MAG: hypothetical protein J6S96_00355, partial [Muribaculaceae bacterium]|nr:hypothetical protein [Muribaculaceae bacterium]